MKQVKQKAIAPFRQDIADEICERIAGGESLIGILKEMQLGHSLIYQWINSNLAFAEQYARARELQAETMADQIHEIADNQLIGQVKTYKDDGKIEVREEDMLQHRKLQIDSRKWLMAKMRPKKYGEIKPAPDESEKSDITIHGGLPE